VKRWILLAGLAALVATVVSSAALGGGRTPATHKASFTAALVSDIGKFTDKGFNQNQLKGLNQAKAKLGVTTLALQSNSTSDYAPNFNTAIRKGAKLVVAAGFLLAPTEATYAKKFPNVDFAITDYTVHTAPFANKAGKVLPAFKNVEGLTYAANESGCLVGVLAAKMAQKMGHKVIGGAGGLKIPAVDSYIAGYKYCAAKAVKGTKTLIRYSGDFVDQTKCSAIAQNEINQGAQVIFQVAGLCGDGALKEASKLHKWGIGVDADEFSVASRILTSALKKTDVGVYDTVKSAAGGHFKGGTNLVFNLKNNGVGVGKISPKVPKSWITLMQSYKTKIIKGKLKPPTVVH